MAEAKRIFMTYGEQRFRYLEEHGDLMDYRYLQSTEGVEFNVLDLPEEFFGANGDDQKARDGDRNAHRRVIRRAVDAGYDFRTGTIPQAATCES